MVVNKRIEKLRKKMSEVGVSVCLIPTSDCHDSEYVSDYFKAREYFSGFTGSAGTLVVSMEEAALFTDGRYFIQAAKELEGTGIELMKMGEANVPTVYEYIEKVLKEGETLGFDGRLISQGTGNKIARVIQKNKSNLNFTFDPAHEVWENRPKLEFKPVYRLFEGYSGESLESKLNRIKEHMNTIGADSHVITSLDDIAWILNLRGDDIKNCPLFFSYLILVDGECHLFANITGNEESLIKEYLIKNGIILHSYEDFYNEGLQSVNIRTKKGILYNKKRINYLTYKSIGENLKVIDEIEPSTRFKCIKNEVEIENIKKANIKDGVAIVRFERWLKNAIISGENLTELSIQNKLYEFRSFSKEMIGPSFDTICAYGEHGAIIHYEADENSNAEVKEGSFLMIDSGAHYLEGTTDVTRTYAIGNVDEKLKHDYTLVLRSMLKLLNYKFLYGARGNNLDMVVREDFWKEGLDFKHGTGHGIGYLLNVHEGPNRIGWKIPDEKSLGVVFEEGMLTSDEPGIYIEGSHGIRIETDILCKFLYEDEYGKFMGFEPVTYVPIDKSAILIDEMKKEEIEYLNSYHKLVFSRLSPYLEGEDLEYLIKATEEI